MSCPLCGWITWMLNKKVASHSQTSTCDDSVSMNIKALCDAECGFWWSIHAFHTFFHLGVSNVKACPALSSPVVKNKYSALILCVAQLDWPNCSDHWPNVTLKPCPKIRMLARVPQLLQKRLQKHDKQKMEQCPPLKKCGVASNLKNWQHH